MEFCQRKITSRSKYPPPNSHRCFRIRGHSGRCNEYWFLKHLKSVEPRVAKKIIRDSRMTTGAPWNSADAGPNRIRRWVMLLPDQDLLPLGIDMASLRPGVRQKLREKAATYEQCISVAQKLTYSVYCMKGAPTATVEIESYLAALFGSIRQGSTKCLICRDTLDFSLFSEARRGKAAIETAHGNPRNHEPDNVGFAHRDCNIAQGPKTLDEFYDWIAGILSRVERTS